MGRIYRLQIAKAKASKQVKGNNNATSFPLARHVLASGIAPALLR